MTAQYEPEIIDLTGNHWAGVMFAIIAVLTIAFVVGSTFPTLHENSANPVPWHSQPKAIFLGLLAGAPVGLLLWASSPRRLVIDNQAITLERVISRRVIRLVHVTSVKIVTRNSRGGPIRFVTLRLRSGEKVVMPAPDGGVDDVYIAISSRLPDRPDGRSQFRQNPPAGLPNRSIDDRRAS